MKTNQQGIAVVGVILAVVVVALIGFAGWQVMQRQQTATTTTEQSAAADTSAPEVKKSEDLSKAESYLETADIDEELDTSELDAALAE